MNHFHTPSNSTKKNFEVDLFYLHSFPASADLTQPDDWSILYIEKTARTEITNPPSLDIHSKRQPRRLLTYLVQNQLFPVLIRFRCNCLRYKPKGERERSRDRLEGKREAEGGESYFDFPDDPHPRMVPSLIRCDFNAKRLREWKVRKGPVKQGSSS